MNIHRNKCGVTLVELIITMAIFSVLFAAAYSVFNGIVRHISIERKDTKTELDIISVVWPLMKEIQTAGFGTASTGPCAPPVRLEDNALIIYSTAAGDNKNAGKWSSLDDDCSIHGISNGETVTIIKAGDREYMGTGSITGGRVSPCSHEYHGNNTCIAFWVPSASLECYETRYALRTYTSGTRPVICQQGTQKISRSVSRIAGSTKFQPLLDCVFGKDAEGDLGMNVRFGCIDAAGNLHWRKNTDCGTSHLRFVRIGVLVQGSTKTDIRGPAEITFFSDLGAPLTVTIDLSDEQRYFRWKKIEETIPLRNLV